RGVKKKDNNGTIDVNTRATEAATIGKNLGNDTTKDNVVMSLAMDEPVVASGINKGMKDGNVGHNVTPIATIAPNTSSVLVTVHESPTTDNSALIRSGPTSYAKLVTGKPSRKSVNFCTLITSVGNGADVAISLESIRAISKRFANTTYGFFLGKRLAYPVVNNYARNTWSKYGLVK
ncbi:hypothetical protein Tco_0081744, partial [Tanacetum coccineum]